MRRRLLLVLCGFALVAVAGFAQPLLASTAAERSQRFLITRAADLDRFAALAQQADGPGGAYVLAQEVGTYAALYGEGVLVVDGAGRSVAAAGIDQLAPEVRAAVDGALRNEPSPSPAVWPWSAEPLLLGRPIGTGTGVGGAVVLRASPAAAAADILVAWAAVLAGVLAAAAAVAVLAIALARWVLRPVGELADAVRAVTAGHPGGPVSPHAGPPELRALAQEFNRMSEAVVASAEQQRRLVADTSHQLRNPLAALRLRLDTLEQHIAGLGRAGYESSLTEASRLETLLEDLLELAAVESAATDRAALREPPAASGGTDVATAVAERVDAWGSAADGAGVRLAVDGGPVATVACPAAELAQVLDVLVDNAVKYAGTGATARIGWNARGGRVRLTVADDGPGLPAEHHELATRRFWRAPDQGLRGSGLGLAIAERIVATRGGRLRVGPGAAGGLAVLVELPCS